MNHKYFIYFFISIMILLAHPFQSGADVNVKKTLQMENSPLDVAVSRNGRWIFILSDSGQILIYSSNGQMVKKIIVGNHVDKIEVGPLENILLLVSKEKKIIEVINLKLPIGLDISGSPSKGPEHAPVVITVFSDFQWVYCSRLNALIEQVLELYPEKINLVFKNFPIKSHEFAMKAAKAALAAHKQGKFWDFHDKLFMNVEDLSDQKIIQIAKELGLEMKKFEKALNDPEIQLRINQDMIQGLNIGVKGVPTIFINTKILKERTLEGFEALIESELK